MRIDARMVKLFSVAILIQFAGCSSDPGQPGLKPDGSTPPPAGNLSTTGETGTETQNGGYGVRIGDKIVSLDLYLRGSDVDPYLSNGVADLLTADEEQVLTTSLTGVRPSVLAILGRKFSDVSTRLAQQASPLKTDFMIQNMKNYTWIMLNETSCTDVGDDHSPIPGKVQLAYREGQWVRFCKEFISLDDANQAALIFHEIVYASLWTKSVTQEFVGLAFNDVFQVFDQKTASEFDGIIGQLQQVSKGNPDAQQGEPTYPEFQDLFADAIASGDVAEVAMLLKAGRTPNELFSGYMFSPGTHPLNLAYDYKQWAVFNLLVQAGADVNLTTQVEAGCFYSTFLACAINDMNNEAVVSILGSPAFDITALEKTGQSWIILATKAANPKAIELLIQAGANVNMVDAYTMDGSAILIASSSNNLPVVQALLTAKTIDLEVRNSDNCEPLHVAAAHSGSPDIVRALVGAGALLEARCGTGSYYSDTPLLALAESSEFNSFVPNAVGVAETLISLGANVKATKQDSEGLSALDLAVQVSGVDLAQLLIQSGSDLNHLSGDFDWEPTFSPLMRAAQKELPDVVAALLKAGAQVNLKNNQNQTALGIATQQLAQEGPSTKLQTCIDLIRKAGGST